MAYRRNELIESLHDGSWFHKHAKLWISGIYLFVAPLLKKRKRNKKKDYARNQDEVS